MAQKINATSWKDARAVLAGGVNSPVRAFGSVGGDPVFFAKGKGAHVTDVDGRSYVDFCTSWGALLMGHAYKPTIKVVQAQVQLGTSFGAPTRLETALASVIKRSFPTMERMRFTSSGTEAVMSAIRLARGYTSRERILKFEGCYHGHADSMLVKAGSGLATFGSPDSLGVPRSLAALSGVLPFNDEKQLERYFKKNANLACAIVEPVAANMGVVPPNPGFLKALRYWTKKTGALLIFDEVITGYRLHHGGAQHIFDVKPDITVLGKIIGGGLPVGCFGASEKIMRALSPEGKVYQAGTLSGNPLSMAAGLSVLTQLNGAFYADLQERTDYFVHQMKRLLVKKNIKASIQKSGSMFTVFLGVDKAENYRQVCLADKKAYAGFFHRLLQSGIYFPPSAFEACFVSQAHTLPILKQAIKAIDHAL